ncbi:unnamed protein product, partial [Prunus brigantina]
FRFGSSELRHVVFPLEGHLPLAGKEACLPWCWEVVTSSCLPKGRCDVTACREGSFQASEGSLSKGSCDVIMPSEGKLRKGAFRREVVTSSCLPKGRCDVTACREEGPSKLRKRAFRREGVTSPRITRGLAKVRKGACRREVLTSSCLPKGRWVLPSFGTETSEGKVSVSSWKSRRPNGNVSYCVEQESRGPSYAFIRLWRAEGVSTWNFREI